MEPVFFFICMHNLKMIRKMSTSFEKFYIALVLTSDGLFCWLGFSTPACWERRQPAVESGTVKMQNKLWDCCRRIDPSRDNPELWWFLDVFLSPQSDFTSNCIKNRRDFLSSKITYSQYWFWSLSHAHKDLSSFSSSFDAIMDRSCLQIHAESNYI